MRNYLMLLTVAFFITISCGSKKENKESESTAVNKEESAEKQESTNETANHPGKPLFVQYCGACHQSDGSGVPGMYPPLQGTKYVNGDVEWLVNNLVNGMEGPIEVKGKEYNNLMPAMDYLTDEEMAKILSYVRIQFGDDVGSVTVEEVSKIRSNLKSQ